MIEVNDLSFRYSSSAEPTLKSLSFAAAPGQVLGFVGPSGAGKSTTQKVLTGQLSHFSGTVKILGQMVDRWGRDLYQHIGVGFELPTHFLRLTGRENLEFFRALYDVSRHRYLDLMEELGLAGALDQRVCDYSKGMKTRLGFARALLHNPQLLFLDEPGGGLDPANVAVVESIIQRERAAGKTIFLTTHDMLTVDRLCDQVAFLIDGTIAVTDDPSLLKQAHGRPEVSVTFGEPQKTETFALDSLGQNPRFRQVIEQYPLHTLHSQEASLSEIFLKLTGTAID
ncbi:MAG: ABC transporter ATP-binding protein [Lysobacterales bacterium]